MKNKCFKIVVCFFIIAVIAVTYEGSFYAAAQESSGEENSPAKSVQSGDSQKEDSSQKAVQDESSNDNGDVEVLTQGAVHEAYAEPQDYDAAKGAKVSKEPPSAIEEIAPDEKPEGENVEWIPGYWNWDDDREDFIWVSGIWRVLPPGRSWVPGYWTAEGSAWVWTPGFWISAETEEVEYISQQPPKSLEVGPQTPAPSPDDLWAPGCWVYTDTRYSWRPGHWVTARANWAWQPPHYVWSPRGYVFIEGYWDWSLERRGVLFAPVYIRNREHRHPSFFYRPSIVIQTSFLSECLFISISSHHFYFGDYYDDRYSHHGIRPWFTYDRHHHGYDPIFSHHRWDHGRNDSRWEKNLHDNYDYHKKHKDSRPPRTYKDQEKYRDNDRDKNNDKDKGHKNLRIGTSLNDYSKHKDTQMRFEKIDSKKRDSMNEKGKDFRKFRDERSKWESDKKDGDRDKSDKNQDEYKIKSDKDSGDEQKKPDRFPKKRDSDKQKDSKSGDIKSDDDKGSRDRDKINKDFEKVSRDNEKDNRDPEKDNRDSGKIKNREENTSEKSESSKHQRVKIPRSPIYSNPNRDSDKIEKTPTMPDFPKPESKVRTRSSERDNSRGKIIMNKDSSDNEDRGSKIYKSKNDRSWDDENKDRENSGKEHKSGNYVIRDYKNDENRDKDNKAGEYRIRDSKSEDNVRPDYKSKENSDRENKTQENYWKDSKSQENRSQDSKSQDYTSRDNSSQDYKSRESKDRESKDRSSKDRDSKDKH